MSDPTPHLHSRNPDELDDIDRLFLRRLDRAEVPDDFTGRVLASTVARTRATRVILAWPWIAAGLVAFGLLTLAGYQLGVRLATSDGIDLVSAVAGDLGLLVTAPGDVLAALSEIIPWWLMAVAAVSAGLLVVAVGNVVARVPVGFRQHALG
ncbi:MAG TPA: hypothetical protein VGQ62_25045 [Chloroflexota bacterium]|jgi:hypothetical protein|nr:hypothetical protein [Chloroflexota bacterium]